MNGFFAQDESRRAEMLSAACAVGVASCFGAPVGGEYEVNVDFT